MNILYQTIGKIGENSTNEDSVRACDGFLAVSDGAGGGGLYADRWSAYLLQKLPDNQFDSFDELDSWVGDIWEEFYQECEAEAQKVGGLLLNKFYDEGSFATLATVYRLCEYKYQWMSYGDSVAFCYNHKTKQLQHSFTALADFSKPPYLISLISPLDAGGFRSGVFEADENCTIFCASDTLSHYLLMMYYCTDYEKYKQELDDAILHDAKHANHIRTALAMDYDFEQSALMPLFFSLATEGDFRNHLQELLQKGLIGVDDYSLALWRN